MIRKLLNLIQDSKDLEVYKEMVRRYELLLKRISNKCDENCGKMYYGNPSVGFRRIKELAETNISKDYTEENMLFWEENYDIND